MSRPLLPRPYQPTPSASIAPQQHQSDALKESQVQPALQVIKQVATISRRRAAAIYRVPQKTISSRCAGRPSRADFTPKSRNLTNYEEQVIVEYMIELFARGFPPRLAVVATMANSLRAERNLGLLA